MHQNQESRLRTRQVLTVSLMVVGYAGFYLCRSDLSVTMPLIIDDLARRGMDPSRAKSWLGWVLTLGTIAYALGKFAAGSLTDLLGGRRNYLLGMAGAVICTIVLALGGPLPVFTVAWFGNRLIQSLGWPGMVKITSRWFSFSSYGRVMGIISLSFLFGDALARAFMGWLITDLGALLAGRVPYSSGGAGGISRSECRAHSRVAGRARASRAGREPGQPFRRWAKSRIPNRSRRYGPRWHAARHSGPCACCHWV